MKDCLYSYELPIKVNNSSLMSWGLFEKIKIEIYFKNQLIIYNFFLNSIIGIRFAAKIIDPEDIFAFWVGNRKASL
jgi:hypothetical protein